MLTKSDRFAEIAAVPLRRVAPAPQPTRYRAVKFPGSRLGSGFAERSPREDRAKIAVMFPDAKPVAA
jgi:hypothetical protein